MEENTAQQHWGYHLLVDMSQCNDRINEPNDVKEFLSELVIKLDMHPLGGPQVHYVDTCEGKGVTGIQIITTSHISFHGDAEDNCVYLDVFSCKPYEPFVVLDLIDQYFEPKQRSERFVHRNA